MFMIYITAGCYGNREEGEDFSKETYYDKETTGIYFNPKGAITIILLPTSFLWAVPNHTCSH